jgi:hypothetical protein
MVTGNWIVENKDHPRELEQMYRKEPEAFKKALASAYDHSPDSQILAVWYERLYFEDTIQPDKVSLFKKDFVFICILAVLAGICSRVLFHYVEQQAISPMNLVFGVLPFIATYFIYKNKPDKKIIYSIGSAFLFAGIALNVLPLELTDTTILAYLHLPFFMWVLVGLSFTGNAFALGRARLAFLKFNGEFAVLYASMAISGIILTGLTMQLFTFVGMDISEFYFSNIVLVGAAALAVVATYLASSNLKLARSITPYIAKIFGPLVLATLLVYLVTVVSITKNPFLDRDFLLTFNGVLLCVLAVSIFSITESRSDEKKTISDMVAFSLIVLALIIDSVALSAIVFRLSSYGITPNRVAVLGVNILIWANLLWIMLAYIRFLLKKTGPSSIQEAITTFLPIYGVWAAFVVFVFPYLF